MKNRYIIGAVAVTAVLATTSCDDFLNDNRFPLSSQTVNKEFWSNSVNVQNQINYFYEDYSGYGNGSGSGSFYWSWLSDDQVGRTAFKDWTFTAVPASSASYTAPYTEIRRASLVIEGVEGSTLPETSKANFIGLARLHRARSYADLIHRYNNVPLIKGVVDPSDTEALYGERTARNEVADFALADFDYACTNIAKQSSKTEFSADLAYAQKMEFCLFEGSWARYHQKDEVRAKKFFEEAVKAGEAIADRYPIGSDYSALYKASAKELGGIPALSSNAEVIFMKSYAEGVFMNSITDYSCASDGVGGLTKSAFDAFLFVDGKPKASTSCNTTDLGVPSESGVDITNLLEVRDQRLAQITQPALMFPGMSWAASNTVG
ncbi:MAG: RagB/SusD family nutrient uptake outer membrane protein, partial [Muribaculaceae bacterium]|nr:RagB/SusD family nutrient uptake outer membrane protein [Muribaculaceae bacterium]